MPKSFETGGRAEVATSWRTIARRCFLCGVVVVFVAARLWHLTSYGLFGDEVFTLWTSGQSWSNLATSVVEDVVHPPLFYALLKIWLDIGGESLLWVKLLPVLFSILSIAPFLLLCRELRMNWVPTSLALWLMAVSGFLIGHAQEARMYSLLLMLALSSLWLFVKLQNSSDSRNRINLALCGVNLLLVFTHYFGWLVVALEFAFLLVWRRDLILRFAVATLTIALCFSPWAYLVVRAARVNPSRATFFWNRPPPMSELIAFYANLNGPLSYRWKVFGTAAVMLVFLSPVIAKFVRALTNRNAEDDLTRFWFLTVFAFAPVALAFVASHLLPQSVWAFRYLIIVAPAYFLIVALSAWELRRTLTGITLIVLLTGWATVSGFAEMMSQDRISWQPLVNRMIQAEREEALKTEAEELRPVNVFVADPNVGNTIQYYLDKAGEADMRVAAVDDFNSLPGRHAWVALIRYNHESQPPLNDSLAKGGYRVGDIIEGTAAGQKAVLFPVWKQ